MKSSRTKPSVPTANATLPSTSRISASAFSATLRNPQSSVYHLRTRLNPTGLTAQTGRKSPSKAELLTTKSSKRTYPLPASISASKLDSSKSMKKHFLSKSNDSLPGASSTVVKKSKNQPSGVPTTTQARGIRHPAVLQHKSPQRVIPDKESALSVEAEDHCTDLITHGVLPDNGDPAGQEMRRSVSSNCLDVGNVVSRDNQRRLSIPDVNRITGATEKPAIMPTVSLLNSNFALAPSQPGVTLVSAGTQTENLLRSVGSVDDFDGGHRRSFNSEMNTEFEDLLQEHSAISRQLSDLCKVEDMPGNMDDAEMGENENGSLSRNDWDSQSNNSLCSEPSLAGLQDRIQQMEETHHSTYEELQATLQELAEMGDLVTVYKKENEDLLHEKTVLQDTLCAMTEKVHVYQTQTESLKKMLYRQAAGDENSSPEGMDSVTDKEKTLVDLMKNLQEEKEELHHQLDSALEQNSKLSQEVEDTHSKLQHLDHWCDEVEKEKKEAEYLLSVARDSLKKQEMETVRLTSLLETEKSKVVELNSIPKNADADQVLNHVRTEKDRLEQQLNGAENRIRVLEHDVESQKEAHRLAEEKRSSREKDLSATAQEYAQRLNCKEIDCKTMEAEVAKLKKECEDMENATRIMEQTRTDIQEQLLGLQSQFTKEQREWNHFQDDLLTAVRVANDFRTECELKTKSVVEENQQLKRKIDDLTGELERLKTKKPVPSPLKTASSTTEATPDIRARLDPLPLRSPVERESVSLRLPRTPSQSISVKSIVQNMESNTRQGSPRLTALVSKAVGIRKRDDNIVQSESNSSLDSTDKIMDFVEKSVDDEPSVPGDGLKPILSTKPRNSLSGESKSDKKDLMFDSLGNLAKGKGSKRNALLKFCQEKTLGYSLGVPQIFPHARSQRRSISGSGFPDADAARVSRMILEVKASPATLSDYFGEVSGDIQIWWFKLVPLRAEMIGIDVTNFSSSWNDGLAFCALLHSYVPDRIPYRELDSKDKRRNFSLAFEAAKSAGIPQTLDINDLLSDDRPDWRGVMDYVISIYRYFEM